jgi:hypothetical protein
MQKKFYDLDDRYERALKLGSRFYSLVSRTYRNEPNKDEPKRPLMDSPGAERLKGEIFHEK